MPYTEAEKPYANGHVPPVAAGDRHGHPDLGVHESHKIDDTSPQVINLATVSEKSDQHSEGDRA